MSASFFSRHFSGCLMKSALSFSFCLFSGLLAGLALTPMAMAQHRSLPDALLLQTAGESAVAEASRQTAAPVFAEKPAEAQQEVGPPVPWRRGKRMTREERRQLRQDINEAGRELYQQPGRKPRHSH
ncbi:MAG: hypothetical protein KUL75_04315 [Sterolibacterium sp.]|nr:hypothetical protein [Sterolibacterium sp.]